MNCSSRSASIVLLSRNLTAQIVKSLSSNGVTSISFARPAMLGLQHHTCPLATRSFSTSRPSRMKEFFPVVETDKVKETKPAWEHPGFTKPQMEAVQYTHRDVRNWSDRVALTMIQTMRWGLDLATGYKHGDGAAMTERKYMIRNVFLESVAGVPGMVAGMLRHLQSMRRMKRDNGWMETLLEESYNERMHLLTFLKMAEPGWFMRTMVLAAQGVFFNAFFVSYLISPRICHRFVGYLEEEAVLTYTRELEDLDAGKLPNWEITQAPEIAVKYWKMPEGQRSMRDLLLYIRADESKHREVNHTLGNLDQNNDPNPYVSEYKDTTEPRPSKGLQVQKPHGWERNEVI